MAVAIARQAGLTLDELAKAVGKSRETIEKLQRGDGSMTVGRLVRSELVRRKLDVSKLPPLDPTEEVLASSAAEQKETPWSEDEWARIGYLINKHGNREWWAQELAKLRKMAEACEVVERELTELSRAK